MPNELILDVDFNLTKAQAKQQKLNAEFEASKNKTAETRNNIAASSENIKQSKVRQLEFEMQLQSTSVKLDSYMNNQLTLSDAEVKALQRRNEVALAGITKEESYQSKQLAYQERAKANLSVQEAKTAQIGAKMKDVVDKSKSASKGWSLFNRNVSKTATPMERNLRRVKELIKSVLIFSLITKAFTALRDQFGNIIKQDEKINKQWLQLKGILAVQGAQLFQAFRPAIEWILSKAIQIGNVISFIISKMTGKAIDSSKQIAKNAAKTADSTNEIAESAKNATAGFDNLQTASSNSNGSAGNTNAGLDVSGIGTLTLDMQSKAVAALTGAGALLLVIGAILTFTAANIPMGLGMMVAGGYMLYTAVKQQDTITPDMKSKVAGIMEIGGTLLLVIGLILCFFGQIPLGIGILAVGGSLLYTSSKMDDTMTPAMKEKVSSIMLIGGTLIFTAGLILCFAGMIPLGIGLLIAGGYMLFKAYQMRDTMTPELKQKVAGFMAIGGSVLLLIGLILCLTGVGIPIGIGMMIAGAGMLFGAVGLSKGNGILEKIKNLAGEVKNIFKSVINWIISGLNKISFTVPDWVPGLAGNKIGFNIPKLATGAVIPGGKPFLAMLGDQKAGQTNIEAPLDTLIAAFKAAQGNQNFTFEATGSMAQLIRMLNLQLKKENERASMY